MKKELKRTKRATRRTIANRVSKILEGTSPTVAIEFVDAVIQAVTEILAERTTLELRQFGVFDFYKTKERPGRNPMHPEKVIMIPSRTVVKFIPSELLKRIIHNPKKKTLHEILGEREE